MPKENAAMTRPMIHARTLALAALVASACGAAWGGTHPGSPARVADPCSPDGTCLPRWETWGVYQTRWRPFPGDVVAGPPTPAQRDEESAEQDAVGGPVEPGPNREGLMGPTPSAGPGVIPGLVPEGPVEGGAPSNGAVPAPEIGPAPGVGADPLDPFGAAPPAPPAWMQDSVRGVTSTSAQAPEPAIVNPAALETSAAWPPVLDGPNLRGDDAPPTLPASLQNTLGSMPAGRSWSSTAAAATLAQPPSVHLQRRSAAPGAVLPASAETTLGMPLINPAAAVATEAGMGGLQQAIYIEASDRDEATPAR